MKSCGTEEAEYKIGPTSQPCEPVVGHRADFDFIVGSSIAQVLLDVAMAIFLGVQAVRAK